MTDIDVTRLRHVHHRCEHCNNIHEIYKGELKRGRGVYCSKECRLYHTKEPASTVTCEICGCTFNTHTDRKRCSIECEQANT